MLGYFLVRQFVQHFDIVFILIYTVIYYSSITILDLNPSAILAGFYLSD